MQTLYEFLDTCKTPYVAVENIKGILDREGFKKLCEATPWDIAKGGKYYVIRDSSVIAFCIGEEPSFMIAASHCDSPCFKLKESPLERSEGCTKYNVEPYGGGIYYTFLDTPLTISGRICVKANGGITSLPFTSQKTFVIPSLAIHFRRGVNEGLKLNAQTDMSPISSIEADGLDEEINKAANGCEVLGSDLFLVSAQKPFDVGYGDALFSSPRIDNLTSVFSSLSALIAGQPKGINVVYIANNEETGSRTRSGAASTFLHDTLKRISLGLGYTDEGYLEMLPRSLFVSSDNAHASHPNHAELSDPTNKTRMGGGVVIKHHAQGNYTTDGMSCSLFKAITGDVKTQDFYMRSDLPCGGTLGAISSGRVSVMSVDVGIAQLAMHSCVETACKGDVEELTKAMTAVFSHSLEAHSYNDIKIK